MICRVCRRRLFPSPAGPVSVRNKASNHVEESVLRTGPVTGFHCVRGHEIVELLILTLNNASRRKHRDIPRVYGRGEVGLTEVGGRLGGRLLLQTRSGYVDLSI